MTEIKPITIIGGGLAGLTLGIGLRQRGIPVSVWEAGHYPRHRVCGEFISGRGQAALARLGLRQTLEQTGAVTAATGAFYGPNTGSPVRPLPAPALCVSRFTLDASLAVRFRQLGGDLRENTRWRQNGFESGVIRASGRRAQPVEDGWRWFGLKVHASNVQLAADLEVHAFPNGYVGLCRLSGGEVNVCGLFRRTAATSRQAQSWQETLRGLPGTPLRERLSAAVLDESSFCSVAGLSLRPQRAAGNSDCCIGDALTMIPPVTGNGMSLAIESAEIAMEPLAAYCRGDTAWNECRQRIARACDAAFARRLAWARWLQGLMLAPMAQGPLGMLALHSAWLWRTLFSKTR